IMLAVAQCGVVKGCNRQPFAAQFDANRIESVTNRPRPAALAPGEPELPRVYLDTTYAAPAGKTINVMAGGDVQKAINQARPGDVIMLQAGATFTGNFKLPDKSGSDWIVIASSASEAGLPPPGERVTPSSASAMAKLVSPNADPAV